MAKANKIRVIRRSKKEPKFDEEIDDEVDAKSRKILRVADARKELKDVASRVAGHNLHHADWVYEKCHRLFPHDPEMRMVSRYYPYAVNGPLYVDEVDGNDKREVMRAKEKLEVLKDAGYRYCWITDSMTVTDVFAQLGEM